MPEISIIMPCYNAEFFIAEAIESLQNQIFLNWELLIVNDGSTDSSRNIATYYEKKDTRIWENQKIPYFRDFLFF